MTACVALSWNANVYLMGRRVPIELIRRYGEGNCYLDYGFDGGLPMCGALWHPEDMAVKPECFLDGLGEGEYGKKNALLLWLDMQSRGLMD
jgi:hypothetical protein